MWKKYPLKGKILLLFPLLYYIVVPGEIKTMMRESAKSGLVHNKYLLSITDGQRDALHLRSRVEGVSMAEILRWALDCYLSGRIVCNNQEKRQ